MSCLIRHTPMCAYTDTAQAKRIPLRFTASWLVSHPQPSWLPVPPAGVVKERIAAASSHDRRVRAARNPAGARDSSRILTASVEFCTSLLKSAALTGTRLWQRARAARSFQSARCGTNPRSSLDTSNNKYKQVLRTTLYFHHEHNPNTDCRLGRWQ